MPSEADLIIGLYQRHADEWMKYQDGRRIIEQHWLDRFQALLPSGGSILDMGCGPGFPIARNFIEHGFRLTGIDTSPQFLAVCDSKFPGQDWLLRDMRSLALDRQFDGLLAWNSFFHLTPEDQRLMFPVFGKHAAPGAPLMFTGGPSFGVAMGTFGGEPLYHASLDPKEYRALLTDNGFDVVMYVAEDATAGRMTIWLARKTFSRP